MFPETSYVVYYMALHTSDILYFSINSVKCLVLSKVMCLAVHFMLRIYVDIIQVSSDFPSYFPPFLFT